MMRKLLILIFGLFILLPNTVFSQDNIDKLDRIISEIGEIKQDIAVLKEGQKAINQRIDDLDQSLNKRISELQNIMFTGFGILFIGILVLICFVLSDRRNALVIEKIDQKQKDIEKILKIYAMKDTNFAEAMQTAGLL